MCHLSSRHSANDCIGPALNSRFCSHHPMPADITSMYRQLVLLAIATVCFGQQRCEQAPVGDETVEMAVPVASFNTSGNDRIRSTWCVAQCKERVSIIATMRFKPSNVISKSHQSTKFIKSDGSMERFINGKAETKADPFDYCIDPVVSAAVDAATAKFNDAMSIAQELNRVINRPGWAYLVYQFGPPPSLVATWNVPQDNDFCEKYVMRKTDGILYQFQVYCGMIWDN